ncbi:hypothetical protein Skr01_37270 [Sphaerisporangium krabiense]|nr:hypothetical protein Skr01_37270 [Sphaerisporangium krabiense]
MTAAVRAELTKIVSLPAVWIATGVIVGLHLLLSAVNVDLTADAVHKITPAGTIEIFAGDPRPAHRALVGFLVASSFQMAVFLPVVGAIIAGQEFRADQLGRSLLAVPRRGRLVAAKALAAAVHLLATSVVIAAISAVFMYIAVKDWDPGLPVSAGAWLGQAKFAAFAVLTGLLGLAVTMIARGALAGVGVTVALTAATMTQALTAVSPALDALLPVSAGRNLLLDPAGDDLTAGPWHAVAVLVAWPLAATLTAAILLARRDAR